MGTPSDVFNQATLHMFVKGRWDNVKKNYPFLAILEQKAHIINGCNGDQLNWLFRAGINSPQDVGDYQDVSQYYVPNKSHVNANLPWGEKAVFDAVSKGEFAKNDGDEVYIRLRDYRMPDMVDDFLSRGTGSLAYALLNTDGSASTAPAPIYGLPSFLGDAGGTASSDNTAVASDTYAGYSTALSGITSVTNPVDSAWTPTLVNTTSSGFGSGASASANILEYLSLGMRSITFDPADSSQRPTCGFLYTTYFDYLRKALGAKQTIFIQEPVSANDAWGVGTSVQYAMHDGIRFYWDANLPTNTSYILNMEQIWLHSLKVPGAISADSMPGKPASRKDMFDCEVNYNDQRRAVTVSVTWRGQMRANPRFHCKLYPYA